MNIITKVSNYLNAPGLIGSITGFTRAKSEEVKIRIQEKAAAILTKVVIIGAICLVALFLLLFASLTASQYLNEVLDSLYAGYGIVTLFYLLLLIILFLIKNVKSLNNLIRKGSAKIVNSFRELT